MQDLGLLIAHGVGFERHWRFHRSQGNQLQQMIRHHVAQRARLFVITAALLDPDFFGRGDLHRVDIATVPNRLEDAVAEAKDQNVLDGFFAEIVINAIDLILFQYALNVSIQLLG